MQAKNHKKRTLYVEKVRSTHETRINRENKFSRSQKHQKICYFKKLMQIKDFKINYNKRLDENFEITNHTFFNLQKFHSKKLKISTTIIY